MNFKVGDVVRINRPLVKINVSENEHGGRGVITEIDTKDRTARVKTNRTFHNEMNWESFSWLEIVR
jgi:hypothetical protein